MTGAEDEDGGTAQLSEIGGDIQAALGSAMDATDNGGKEMDANHMHKHGACPLSRAQGTRSQGIRQITPTDLLHMLRGQRRVISSRVKPMAILPSWMPTVAGIAPYGTDGRFHGLGYLDSRIRQTMGDDRQFKGDDRTLFHVTRAEPLPDAR